MSLSPRTLRQFQGARALKEPRDTQEFTSYKPATAGGERIEPFSGRERTRRAATQFPFTLKLNLVLKSKKPRFPFLYSILVPSTKSPCADRASLGLIFPPPAPEVITAQ